MQQHSIFFEEWRRCLGEQYKFSVRRDDQITLKTLVPTLQRLGFSDEDLRQLYFEATLRADELPEDFLPEVPDFSPPEPEALPAFQAHPAECTCPACVEQVNLAAHDAEGQPLAPEDIPPPEEDEKNIFPVVKPSDDKPKQISLF